MIAKTSVFVICVEAIIYLHYIVFMTVPLRIRNHCQTPNEIMKNQDEKNKTNSKNKTESIFRLKSFELNH